MKGLFICATPIGNLDDATFRLINTLKAVDVVAAEDTRRTKVLLSHYGIEKQTMSYHKFSTEERKNEILAIIEQGRSVALLSDAGTPAVSDPGFELINAAIENGIPVTFIPGPSAVLSAAVLSGIDCSRYVFEGFLPREGKMRRRILRGLSAEGRAMIFFESPHRLLKSLKDILEIFGDRKICVAREMTKVHEEYFRGKVSEAIASFSSRKVLGEITMVVEGGQEHRPQNTDHATQGRCLTS